MRSLVIVIVALIAVLRGLAYTEAELKLWYGNDNDRAPIDDLMEEVSSKPMSMSMQEYRAFQATNQIPVMADVIASNIAHAVQMGQSTNGVTWTTDEELRMRILPQSAFDDVDGRSGRGHVCRLHKLVHADKHLPERDFL